MFKDKDSGYTIGACLQDDGVDINRLKNYIQADGYQLLKVANKEVKDLELVEGYFDLSTAEMQYISPLEGRVDIEIRPASALLTICLFVICGAAY